MIIICASGMEGYRTAPSLVHKMSKLILFTALRRTARMFCQGKTHSGLQTLEHENNRSNDRQSSWLGLVDAFQEK